MSRAGRPSQRDRWERHLIGPREIYDRLMADGGVPEEVMEELRANTRSAATERAAEAMDEIHLAAAEHLRQKHREVGYLELPADDDNRQMAWMLSLLHTLKQSIPKKNWCRHLRAADPRISEIRSVAVPKAAAWLCIDCLRERPNDITANLWPTQCDMCGRLTKDFNGLLGKIPGCQVELHICDDCRAFVS